MGSRKRSGRRSRGAGGGGVAEGGGELGGGGGRRRRGGDKESESNLSYDDVFMTFVLFVLYKSKFTS